MHGKVKGRKKERKKERRWWCSGLFHEVNLAVTFFVLHRFCSAHHRLRDNQMMVYCKCSRRHFIGWILALNWVIISVQRNMFGGINQIGKRPCIHFANSKEKLVFVSWRNLWEPDDHSKVSPISYALEKMSVMQTVGGWFKGILFKCMSRIRNISRRSTTKNIEGANYVCKCKNPATSDGVHLNFNLEDNGMRGIVSLY